MDLKLRVAICDDEKYFREEIKRLVEQYLKEKKIIFCIDLFTSGLEFCSDDNNLQQYDIIFLDIGMKEMNGMETAYAIREKNQNVDIVLYCLYSKKTYRRNHLYCFLYGCKADYRWFSCKKFFGMSDRISINIINGIRNNCSVNRKV